jgi:hypothetical protein
VATTPVINSITPAMTHTWFQKHERLLIVFMALVLGGFCLQSGMTKYFDSRAEKAEARAVLAEQAKTQADANAAASLAQTAQVAAQYQAMAQADKALIASLAQAVAQRQAVVVAQQGKDATLPLTELATRLQALGNAPPGSVTIPATPANSVNLTQPAAVAVTQTLELVPVLQADLKDETTIASTTQGELNKANELIASQGITITDLGVKIVKDDAACTADKNVLKADAKKNNIKWFKRGLYVGFAGGFIIGEKVGKFIGL